MAGSVEPNVRHIHVYDMDALSESKRHVSVLLSEVPAEVIKSEAAKPVYGISLKALEDAFPDRGAYLSTPRILSATCTSRTLPALAFDDGKTKTPVPLYSLTKRDQFTDDITIGSVSSLAIMYKLSGAFFLSFFLFSFSLTRLCS